MLNFQYPTWYFLFCALLGALFAATLYFRNNTFREQSPQLNRILGVLRFLSGTLIAALLLSPLLKSTVTDIRKPVVVLAQDVSESIGVAIRDTPQYKANFEALAARLSEKYDVKTYSFGEKVREGAEFSFKDKLTNASDLMTNVYDLYANQNLGAVVIATDGIYNEGSNPLYAAAKLNAPVYTVALGDTTPKKDLVVKRVFHNNIAYLGDKFNIQIDVAATNCAGGSSSLTVAKLGAVGNPSVVSTAPISVNKNDFFTTKEVTLDATQAGIMRFRINLTPLAGEVSTVNNTKEIFIEVLDARTKILLLGNAPHPDIAALSEAVSVNKNYTLTVAYADDLKINPADFDFIVLHNLPSTTQPLDAILNNLNAKKIPRLFIVGAQSDARKLTAQQSMMALNSDGKNVNDVQASLNNGFNLFTLEDNYRKIPEFNPIVAPFGEFKEIGGGQVLFYQKIGKVETKYPLIMLGESNGIRTGIITAEGLWKWRLFDFAQQKNHDIFDGLMSKICTYLSVKEDKRKFRASTDKNVYRENEPVQFSAEIYNNSYELINEADVRVIVTNGEGKQFPYTMNKSGRAYALNAGILPVGNYTYKSTTSIGGQQLEAGGAFSIQPIQLELYETTADHALLRALSNQLGGSVVMPQNMASLADSILAKNLKPVMYTTQKTENALNLKWIFGILITLLAAEWFMRRYFGGY